MAYRMSASSFFYYSSSWGLLASLDGSVGFVSSISYKVSLVLFYFTSGPGSAGLVVGYKWIFKSSHEAMGDSLELTCRFDFDAELAPDFLSELERAVGVFSSFT